MDSKTNKTIKVYLIYMLLTGVSVFIFCTKKAAGIAGLAISAAVVVCNFKLLEYVVLKCMTEKKALKIPQILVFRALLYVAAAYLCMKIEHIAVITYSIGVIELTFAALTVYGREGKNDKR